MTRLARAIAVAALVAGCGSVHPLTSGPSDVPWLPLPPNLTQVAVPSPQAVPVPPGTPTCTLADLEAAVIGSNGATGHIITVFAFGTRGANACQVEGTPTVTLVDAAGHDLGFKNRAPYFPNQVSGPALVEPGPAPIAGIGLKYGMAGLSIDWISQGESCPGETASNVAAARLAIAGVGTVAVAIPIEPAGYACQGVGVGDLAEPPVTAGDAGPGPSVPLPAVIAPAQVKAGVQFHYIVTLTNPTKLPIDLRASCPNYMELLFSVADRGDGPVGGKNIYGLNCAAAGVLEPGKPMRFAMVIPVPAQATPGSYYLDFSIGFGIAMTKFATAVVKIA